MRDKTKGGQTKVKWKTRRLLETESQRRTDRPGVKALATLHE